ncbi:hypothetical protein CWC22_011265 [Pseudoalteromonas rubra]|uniref:Lipoprotein n=2 Tax=Pseudoalteromonas rubra TaxID=43658 RepID=A0A5S3V501_9GAMM|nr:hypothetical protein [Pseudoalteromonas rubra]QPB83534.1 hypothetical protein CWC22_011265 [Pseudoalteromonas rubra]
MKKLLLLIALFISGCTTELWAPEYKQEVIDGFYVKSDSGELFVTASSSAYLFKINKNFGEALTLSREVDFYPSFNDFELRKDNTIIGVVSLTLLTEEPSPELENQLLSLGFKKDELLKRYRLTNLVEGKRFMVEGDLPLEKLEKRQRIAIAQPSTFSQTAGKIVATPATIVIDSVVVVPAVFIGATIMAAGGG